MMENTMVTKVITGSELKGPVSGKKFKSSSDLKHGKDDGCQGD